MSFLERMKTDKAARDKQAAQEKLAQQQAQARQEEAGSRARELEAQKRAEGDQARAYLQGSVAEDMLKQLASIIEDSHFLPTAQPYKEPTKAVTSLSWDHKNSKDRIATFDEYHQKHGSIPVWGQRKEIQIEADSIGTITIKGGGLFGSGSTTLTREQAKNPKLVEQALEKAYTHPQSKGYRNQR